MMTTTPIGVETLRSLSPLGRTRSSSTRPTGSGRAATSRKLRVIAAMRPSSSRNRSSIAADRPIPAPASRSRALASLMAAAPGFSASAIATRQAFFSALLSFASSRDAPLACLASCLICSLKVMAANLRQNSCLKKVKKQSAGTPRTPRASPVRGPVALSRSVWSARHSRALAAPADKKIGINSSASPQPCG